jgi:hypothetical protein
MLLITEDSITSNTPGPEALIEEARQRQRQRARRRSVILAVAAFLAVLGFGIDQLVQGSSSVGATPPAAAGNATKPAPTVTYEKVVVKKFVPGLPVETTTIETWSAPDGTTNRQIVTSAGRRFEIGAVPHTDKLLGLERLHYLYDRTTGAIYQAGYSLTWKKPSLKQQFKQILAEPGVHRAGTTTYRGRKVYVLRFRDDTNHVHGTGYVDERTFEPMLRLTQIGNGERLAVHTMAFKTLPATTANLALTSLTAMHPTTRLVPHGSPRSIQLYGEAAYLSGQPAAGPT